jgi:hypothetical protein
MSSSSVLGKGVVREGENEEDGGSCTRDNAICHCTFLLPDSEDQGPEGSG